MVVERWTAEQFREYQKTGRKPKQSKYRAKKVVVDGIPFPSQKEAGYYTDLKMLVRAGEIAGFCRQPRFVVGYGDENTKATEYVADYIIFYNDDTYKIVDTKGMETQVFKIKMKLMHEKYPKLTIHKE